MHISFVAPTALWLLLILLPVWAVALLTPRRLSRTRFWGSLVLRTAMIAALVLAVAGLQIVRSVDDLTTVFLIDSSELRIGVGARAGRSVCTRRYEEHEAQRQGGRGRVWRKRAGRTHAK